MVTMSPLGSKSPQNATAPFPSLFEADQTVCHSLNMHGIGSRNSSCDLDAGPVDLRRFAALHDTARRVRLPKRRSLGDYRRAGRSWVGVGLWPETCDRSRSYRGGLNHRQ